MALSKKRRRDYGTGGIRKRADGRHEGRFYTGEVDPVTGDPKKKSVYGKTEAEVKRKLKELERARDSGEQIITDGRILVEAYANTYITVTLESRVQSEVIKRSTAEWHTSMLRKHVVPVWSQRRVDSLTSQDIEVLLLGLSDYSASLRRGVFTALSLMLDAAVRDGVVRRNVASPVRRPKVRTPKGRFLNLDELARLLDGTDGPMHMAMLTMAVTGLRRGEILGLRWEDVDTESGTLAVSGAASRTKADGLLRGTPKTETSKRIVPVPPMIIDALKAYRLVSGPLLPVASAPVFPSSTGTLWDPRNFSRQFTAAAERVGVRATPHNLRDSAATAMINAGVPLTTVSDVLGHSDIRITAEVYTHVIDEQRRGATTAVADELAKRIGVKTWVKP